MAMRPPNNGEVMMTVYEVQMKLPKATWDIPPLYRGVYFDTRAEAEAHIAELIDGGALREDCTIATRYEARQAAQDNKER